MGSLDPHPKITSWAWKAGLRGPLALVHLLFTMSQLKYFQGKAEFLSFSAVKPWSPSPALSVELFTSQDCRAMEPFVTSLP
eukprot:scaffold180645_cov17-Tisochrysis_lutea.AAC.1